MRAKYPGIQVIVHPECRWEVCQKADALGSTERLIKLVEEGAGGQHVRHRDRDPPGEPSGEASSPRRASDVMTLDDTGCLCTTMYRICPQHLAWALENLVEGRVVNRIQVDGGCETLGEGGAGPHAGNRRSRVQGCVRRRQAKAP